MNETETKDSSEVTIKRGFVLKSTHGTYRTAEKGVHGWMSQKSEAAVLTGREVVERIRQYDNYMRQIGGIPNNLTVIPAEIVTRRSVVVTTEVNILEDN